MGIQYAFIFVRQMVVNCILFYSIKYFRALNPSMIAPLDMHLNAKKTDMVAAVIAEIYTDKQCEFTANNSA